MFVSERVSDKETKGVGLHTLTVWYLGRPASIIADQNSITDQIETILAIELARLSVEAGRTGPIKASKPRWIQSWTI